MPSPRKASSSASTKRASTPKGPSSSMLETTGATPPTQSPEKATPSVAETVAGSGTVTSAKPSWQTDGAYIPITGPVTNVRQLVRGPNAAKNSIESFATLSSYVDYLRRLRPTELHRHAVEEARVVPIDDTARLIRRLEANWTAVASREKQRQGVQTMPARAPFSAEQAAAQEKIRREMLGGRA